MTRNLNFRVHKVIFVSCTNDVLLAHGHARSLNTHSAVALARPYGRKAGNIYDPLQEEFASP